MIITSTIRAQILKYSNLFKTCRNSAPGKMGLSSRKAKALADKVKVQRSLSLQPRLDYQRSVSRAQSYDLPMTGRWYNHVSGKMEDYSPKKKNYNYYG